ncbi:non-ribosomal peptide synthetase [Sinisalibacter lacisalsi]|uniref:Carrier domain-containing protein n=1 Tax=Sinisalibacter lacisalsi TaxID=1526570 RepID=A0ABQ1QLA5_9RHOB|nr:non-ribosomal peptide synthetase [Sinisalibacter lacisalsi]GGD29872.1 hypothetical protein GCM10011358_12380 [Sinisalibacter lacisalsi]
MTLETASTTARRKAMLDRLRQSAEPRPRPGPGAGVDFSPEQRALLSSEMLHKAQPVANLVRSWSVVGPLDVAALEQAFARLVDRHDALRMSVVRDGKGARPVFAPHVDAALLQPSVTGRTADERLAEIDAQIARETLVPFARDGSNLWRARLYRVDETRHVLAVFIHHLIADDWSWRILARDLFRFYEGAITDSDTGLPPAASFAEHLSARTSPERAPVGAPHPEIHWPDTAFELDGAEAVRRDIAERALDAAQAEALRDVARIHGCTPFHFLLACYAFLLATYCDQDAFGISLSPDNRTGPAEANAIGLFVRNVEVGADIGAAHTFADLLRNARHELRSTLARTTDPIHLGRAVIGYYNAPDPGLDAGRLSVTERPTPQATQSANLHLSLHPGPTGIAVTFAGQRSRFSRDMLERLADCYLLIARQAIANPQIPLAEIDLVAPAQAAAQADRSNAVTTPADGDDITTLFAGIAAAHPEEEALTTPSATLSYAALDRKTNALAHWLQRQGLGEGDRIGVAMPRSAAVFMTWLAVLKAGLTVVPVDPDLPLLRVRHILDAANCKALISGPGPDATLADEGARLLHMPAAFELDALPQTPPRVIARSPDHEAFVMFTSGTTGPPKSIPVPHAALVRLARGARHLPVGPGDRMIQLASPGFDGSFVEVWGAWLRGAALVLFEKNIFAEGGLAIELRKLKPTASFMTTSLFNMLVDADPAVLSPLKYLAIGGEAASASHCRRARAANPSLRLSNAYGPTENGALTTSHEIPPDLRGKVPIGRPLPGNMAFVLSTHQRPVPEGFAGELCVGGPGLSPGYENPPQARAETFIRLNAGRLGLGAGDPVTLYRTGDRACWNPAGEIEFLGRRDSQFKFHGFRIEPSEIDSALTDHPAVGRAATIPDRRGDGTVCGITAYIEPVGGVMPSERDLRAFLAKRLPRPALPSRYVRIDAIPLTPNGKADIPALVQSQPAAQEEPGARSDDPLTRIWEDVLQRNVPAGEADFHALGGTSLQLVQMILEVEKVFGVEVDFGSFADDPTIQRLRTLIALSPSRQDGDRRHLRVLREGRAELPAIVLLPVATGQVAWAIDLLGALSVENPVLALRFEPPSGVPLASTHFADLIESLLDDLAGRDPAGPFTLVGFSFGGTLAGYLAGRAAERGIDIDRIIVIDSSSPLARLPLPGPEQKTAKRALVDQLFLYPAGPITCEFHLLTSTRRFPFAGADNGLGWAHFATGAVSEYVFDTDHGAMVTPPVADRVARLIEDILAHRARPDRARESRCQPALLEQIHRIKGHALAGRRSDAARLLERLVPDSGDIPAWIVVGLIRIYRETGQADRLRALGAMSDRFASPLIWEALAPIPGYQKRRMLRACLRHPGARAAAPCPWSSCSRAPVRRRR